MPAALWETPFEANSSSRRIYDIDNLPRAVFLNASRGTEIRLNVEGVDIISAATAFIGLVREAVTENDFTKILSRSRNFSM